MAKQKRQKRSTKARKQAQSVAEPHKRSTLATLRNMGIAGVIVAAGAAYGVGAVQTTVEEFDLTRIGQGIPAVVQIHDPNCSRCRSLQKQTRKALKSFEETDVIFLVANIKTPEGQALAARHNVGHVTLLFFDGEGQMKKNVHGTQTRGFIRNEITEHLGVR